MLECNNQKSLFCIALTPFFSSSCKEARQCFLQFSQILHWFLPKLLSKPNYTSLNLFPLWLLIFIIIKILGYKIFILKLFLFSLYPTTLNSTEWTITSHRCVDLKDWLQPTGGTKLFERVMTMPWSLLQTAA